VFCYLISLSNWCREIQIRCEEFGNVCEVVNCWYIVCVLISDSDFLPRGSGIVTRRPLILQLMNSKEGMMNCLLLTSLSSLSSDMSLHCCREMPNIVIDWFHVGDLCVTKFQSVSCGWSLPSLSPSQFHFPSSFPMYWGMVLPFQVEEMWGNMSSHLRSEARPPLPAILMQLKHDFEPPIKHMAAVSLNKLCCFLKRIYQIAFRRVIIESWWVSRWTDQNAGVTHSMRMTS